MLLSLPNELILDIADQLSDTTDVSALSQTSRHLSQLLQSTLDKESQRLQDAAKTNNQSLIHFSALSNNIPGTKLDLKLNPNCIDEFSNDYGTGLHIAIKNGFPKLLHVLLDQGADPNRKMKMGHSYVTPLHFMLCTISERILNHGEYQEIQIPMVQQLLQSGANPIASHILHGHAFRHIVVGRVPELVTAILATGKVDINNQNGQKLTVLHNAIRFWGSDSFHGVQKLLELGIKIDAPDYNNQSAIFHACRLNNGVPLIELLMQYGCNLNIQDYEERTIFHYIALRMDHEIAICNMKQVLSSETTCLINLRDCEGKTALDYATLNLNKELVNLLIEYEEKVLKLVI